MEGKGRRPPYPPRSLAKQPGWAAGGIPSDCGQFSNISLVRGRSKSRRKNRGRGKIPASKSRADSAESLPRTAKPTVRTLGAPTSWAAFAWC